MKHISNNYKPWRKYTFKDWASSFLDTFIMSKTQGKFQQYCHLHPNQTWVIKKKTILNSPKGWQLSTMLNLHQIVLFSSRIYPDSLDYIVFLWSFVNSSPLLSGKFLLFLKIRIQSFSIMELLNWWNDEEDRYEWNNSPDQNTWCSIC